MACHQADVIWYGDSIIQYWGNRAPNIWKYYMENDGFYSVMSGLAGKYKHGGAIAKILTLLSSSSPPVILASLLLALLVQYCCLIWP
jgi:hypothetical protein